MIYSHRFKKSTFEILWSYGVSLGIRGCPPIHGVAWGLAIDLPLLIVVFWRDAK
jgi:hypothetical protein